MGFVRSRHLASIFSAGPVKHLHTRRRPNGMTRPKKLLISAAVAAIVVAAGVYWFAPQNLIIDDRVDEALPVASIDGGNGSAAAEADSAPPTILSQGEFRSLEHETSGIVSVIELEDGTRYVRIEGLDTSNGPDVRVYLSEAPADGPVDALDNAFIDLGGLKGNQGDQNYEIPDGVDLDDFESVSIWCRRFSAGFGVAPLASFQGGI
jgi:hypothetical protein